ncbi:MAG: S8 family serine peptidase, partial [Fibrobacterales bacterium]
MKIKSTIKKASTFSLFTALSVFASGFSPTSIEGTLSPLDAPIDKTTTFTNTTDKTVSYSYRARQLTRPASQAQATAALSVPKPEITEDYLDGKEYVEGRFFVSINEFAGYRASSSLPAVLSKYKIKKSKEINKKKNKAFKAFSGISKKSYVITLEDKSKQALKKALKELSKDPQVNYVHPDWKVSLNATPNDESFDNLWGMHNTGQLGGIPGADISAVEAWDISTGSENVIIGVIDSGVDYLHPDLKDNMWVNVNEIPDNGIDDDGNGYIDDINGYDFYNNDADPMDDHNHGTHVSGTIAGKANNNIGVAGVMWKAKIMALKFISKDNEGSLEGAIAAINYATDMGAALTNNSWGGGGYAPALEEAIAAGPLFVAAAGNDNVDNDLFPHYPSSYDLDNIISVAASDRYDHRSDFSQWGLTTVDLAAPGSSIYSSLRNNTYGSFNGTSMATPHVSGVAGLIKSISPTLTAIEVKNILLSSVDPLDAFAGLTVTGGRLNAHTSLINTSPKWVTITDNGNGTLAPGESITLSMTFDANELDAGAWTSVLDFTTNDGAETVHTLPITMNVLECRTLDFDAQSVTFPDTWVGDFSMQTIRISNTCNAATSISSIMATTSEFTPNIAAPLVIGARSSITIPVTFAPLDETNYLNELVILSDAENASEITAELIGTGLFGPQVVINPVEVSEVLEGEQTSHIPVVISNPGARDLIFTLNDAFADKNTWLSFPTQEFTVASGDAETIQVTLASANLLGGVYNASITVSHNAVGNKVSTIPVTLTIEADNFFTPVETDLNWGTVTNPTQPNFTFSPANGLDSSDGGFTLVDMDQDGDLDFLASSNWEDPYRKLDYATLYWVENTDVCDGRWVEHKILDEFMGMYYGMDAGDIDGDGDMDIITQTGYRGHGNELFWLENDGNFNFTRHDLNGPNMLNNIKLMDFDNDGDLDLTAKSDFYTDPLIDIFINDGSGNFVEHQYFTGSSADMQILDYNNDGFLDFVGNERDNDLGVSQYVWYENGQDNATFTKRVLIADLGGSKS